MKHLGVFVLIAGIVVEMSDSGTSTSPFYSIDQMLPSSLSLGLLLIIAGGGMLFFGKTAGA